LTCLMDYVSGTVLEPSVSMTPVCLIISVLSYI
jgi:hypothetical protein